MRSPITMRRLRRVLLPALFLVYRPVALVLNAVGYGLIALSYVLAAVGL